MIKTLQRRFIFTAMAAITGLILLLLGTINGANVLLVNQRLDHTLELLGEAGGDVGNLPPPQPGAPPERLFGLPEMARSDYDVFMSSNYFVVRFDGTGQAVYVDISRTSAVSETEAIQLACQALEKGQHSGRSGSFRFLIKDEPMGRSSTIFLDTAGESVSYLRVLLLSAAVGFVCWAIMLAMVIMLSKRAIRPIAENIERQKQFVTNAGHELKTPLAIIQSNTEAMELYTGESKWSRNIREQAGRMDVLVKDLLMLARMDEGAAGNHPEDFSLDLLLGEALDQFIQPMETKGILLTQEITPNILIHADQAQIRQLFSILLDNVVKHGVPGGTVQISLCREERRVRFMVQNTCAVLPDVPPEKLFDRFYRADAARDRKTGGYGIGLSMAQSLAQANQASISAGYIQPNSIYFLVRFH